MKARAQAPIATPAARTSPPKASRTYLAGTVYEALRRDILEREFVPGEPYLFATDPDGYEVEVWYEITTDSVR